MNKIALDLNQLDLNLNDEQQENFDDEETWLFQPISGGKEDSTDEDLDKWLEGAIVEKMDYRTRSALSRRLDKKKKKSKSENRKVSNVESSLSMIEEVSGESSTLSDRELAGIRGTQKAKSDITVDSDEEEQFYDARSLPDGASPRKVKTIEQKLSTHSQPRFINLVTGSPTLMTPKNTKAPVAQAIRSDLITPERVVDIHNLSEIERRALEQERELQIELQSHRQHLLLASGDKQSRPNSSSSTSSNLLEAQTSAVQLPVSRSVDFHNNSNSNSDSPGLSTSRSNEGSLADLASVAECLMSSRLPLPRRPAVPGRTSIPVPKPNKRSLIAKRKSINSVSADGSSPTNSVTSSVQLNDDDECF